MQYFVTQNVYWGIWVKGIIEGILVPICSKQDFSKAQTKSQAKIKLKNISCEFFQGNRNHIFNQCFISSSKIKYNLAEKLKGKSHTYLPYWDQHCWLSPQQPLLLVPLNLLVFLPPLQNKLHLMNFLRYHLAKAKPTK